MKIHEENKEYKILVGRFQQLVYIEADEMILKYTMKSRMLNVWTGFKWFKIKLNEGLSLKR
jgi:hypothetical protein